MLLPRHKQTFGKLVKKAGEPSVTNVHTRHTLFSTASYLYSSAGQLAEAGLESGAELPRRCPALQLSGHYSGCLSASGAGAAQRAASGWIHQRSSAPVAARGACQARTAAAHLRWCCASWQRAACTAVLALGTQRARARAEPQPQQKFRFPCLSVAATLIRLLQPAGPVLLVILRILTSLCLQAVFLACWLHLQQLRLHLSNLSSFDTGRREALGNPDSSLHMYTYVC